MNRSVQQGDVVNLSPGEDGMFGTADDTNDGWILVEDPNRPHISGYVPEAYLKKLDSIASPPPPPPPMEAEKPVPPPPDYYEDEEEEYTYGLGRTSDSRTGPTSLADHLVSASDMKSPAGAHIFSIVLRPGKLAYLGVGA